MAKNFVEELKWRGMLAQIMPGTEELLQREMVTAYLGTDPTADSLHIGHLVGVMMLKHLQKQFFLFVHFSSPVKSRRFHKALQFLYLKAPKILRIPRCYLLPASEKPF